MFHIISKITSFAFSPFLWIFALFCLFFFLKGRWKDISIKSALFLLFLFSNNFFYKNIALYVLESPKPYKQLSEYELGIVLCGMVSGQIDGRINFHPASDRLFQAIDLYKRKYIKKIFLSGGSSLISENATGEADLLESYLLRLGIPQDDIIKENKSKNTYQNALFTRQYIEKNNIEGKLLLITSSMHIKRAELCFLKQGLEVETYPTNFGIKNKNFLRTFIIPDVDILFQWDELIHEVLGLAIYKFQGYI